MELLSSLKWNKINVFVTPSNRISSNMAIIRSVLAGLLFTVFEIASATLETVIEIQSYKNVTTEFGYIINNSRVTLIFILIPIVFLFGIAIGLAILSQAFPLFLANANLMLARHTLGYNAIDQFEQI